MEKAKKIYLGNGKGFGDNLGVNFSICLDKIPEEHVFTAESGKRYLKCTIMENYEGKEDQYGNTHNVTVNTWKPEGASADATPDTGTTESVPF